MVGKAPRLSRDQLLAALDAGWGRFLPAVKKLSDEEMTVYALRQGYPRLQDFLAHICAWWEETVLAVPAIMNEHLHAVEDIDAFNAGAVLRYREWLPSDVEAQFQNLLSVVRRLIAEVPDKALENADVYSWLYSASVEHYEEHVPPDGARLTQGT